MRGREGRGEDDLCVYGDGCVRDFEWEATEVGELGRIGVTSTGTAFNKEKYKFQ